jgi:hypothetical protein
MLPVLRSLHQPSSVPSLAQQFVVPECEMPLEQSTSVVCHTRMDIADLLLSAV